MKNSPNLFIKILLCKKNASTEAEFFKDNSFIKKSVERLQNKISNHK